MTWLLIGIIPPLLWAVVNHIDKYLLVRTKSKFSIEVLMLYSTLFSILVLPIVFFLTKNGLFSEPKYILVQIFGGLLMTMTVFFYLKALNEDETSVVMPLSLLVPVFSYTFSYFLIGETLSVSQMFACLIIIVGSAILSVDLGNKNKISIKYKVLLYIIPATMFQAAQETVFKFASIDNSFGVSIFWFHTGILICGLFLVIFKKGLFVSFIDSIKKRGARIFSLNIVSESVSTVGYVIQNYVLLFLPVALVSSLDSYQPLFVFVLGIISTIFFPNLATENIEKFHLIHKSIGISIIILGTMVLFNNL